MDQRAIIDVVCKSGIENLAVEIGALLGRELKCTDIQLQLTSKDTLFGNLERPPTCMTRMTISGDQEGECYLLTELDCSIVLGGTLIMLPEDMIEEQVQEGKLDGELNDAFGEVANIIAGVFTQAFVDKYKNTIRFIKQTVEELTPPTKIDMASDAPCPPGTYYIASCRLMDGDESLGRIEFVVPIAAFELEEPETAAAQATAEPVASNEPGPAPSASATEEVAASAPDASESAAAEPDAGQSQAPEAAAQAEPKPAAKPPFADAKKLTDVVFKTTIGQIGEEIGALLGQDLVCDDIQLLMTSKADFFAEHCTEKVTMADLKVSGDRQGCGFMFTRIPDAIILGGTLIMLPEDQIEEQAGKQQLEGETEDAFAEVANILAGGLTQVFLERYPKQLRFVRTDSSLVVPTKIDHASDDPFPEGDYYLASFALHMEGHELNRILLLFPAEIFDLDGYQGEEAEVASSEPAASQPAAAASPAEATPAVAEAAPPADAPPVVLIISEEPGAAQPFADILTSVPHNCKILNFQDDIKAIFQQHQVLGVIFIMAQVSEKGFATAIKLQASGQRLPPLIFAGPEWTRSTVLRAVKYGARDILILPASGDEIEAKVNQHFLKAS